MDEVELVDYDPRWPALFDQEARRLRSVLDPSLIIGLEHFGSTSIPGLLAKPIIDILIVVRSLVEAQATFVAALGTLDYVYWADNPKQDRMFFVKSMPPLDHGVRTTCMLRSSVERCGSGWLSGTICVLIRRKLQCTRGSSDGLPLNTGRIVRLTPRPNQPTSRL